MSPLVYREVTNRQPGSDIEKTVWEIGFYFPDGRFECIDQKPDKGAAGKWVHYLNGGEMF